MRNHNLLGTLTPKYSKYAFLGALRSAAQMVSYEVSIGLILIVRLVSEHVWIREGNRSPNPTREPQHGECPRRKAHF
jgi:hypothetical protein